MGGYLNPDSSAKKILFVKNQTQNTYILKIENITQKLRYASTNERSDSLDSYQLGVVSPNTCKEIQLSFDMTGPAWVLVLHSQGVDMHKISINSAEDLKIIIFNQTIPFLKIKEEEWIFYKKLEESRVLDPRNICHNGHNFRKIYKEEDLQKIEGCFKCLNLRQMMVGENKNCWHQCPNCTHLYCKNCYTLQKNNSKQSSTSSLSNRKSLLYLQRQKVRSAIIME